MGVASLLQNPCIFTFDAQGNKNPAKTSTSINGFSNQSNVLIVQAPIASSTQLQVAYYLPTGKIIGYRPLTLYGVEQDLTQYVTSIPQSVLSEASVNNSKQLKVSIREVLLVNFLGIFNDDTELPTEDVVIGSQAFVLSTGTVWKYEVGELADSWVDTEALNYDYKQKKTYELINLSVGGQFLATEEELQDEMITDIILQSLASLNALYTSITQGAVSVQLKDYLLKDFVTEYQGVTNIDQGDETRHFVFQFGDNHYKISKKYLEESLHVLADKVVEGADRKFVTALQKVGLNAQNNYNGFLRLSEAYIEMDGAFEHTGAKIDFSAISGDVNRFIRLIFNRLFIDVARDFNLKANNISIGLNNPSGAIGINNVITVWSDDPFAHNEFNTHIRNYDGDAPLMPTEEDHLVVKKYVDDFKTEVDEFAQALFDTLRWGEL